MSLEPQQQLPVAHDELNEKRLRFNAYQKEYRKRNLDKWHAYFNAYQKQYRMKRKAARLALPIDVVEPSPLLSKTEPNNFERTNIFIQ